MVAIALIEVRLTEMCSCAITVGTYSSAILRKTWCKALSAEFINLIASQLCTVLLDMYIHKLLHKYNGLYVTLKCMWHRPLYFWWDKKQDSNDSATIFKLQHPVVQDPFTNGLQEINKLLNHAHQRNVPDKRMWINPEGDSCMFYATLSNSLYGSEVACAPGHCNIYTLASVHMEWPSANMGSFLISTH